MPAAAMNGEPIPTMVTTTCGEEYMDLSLTVKEPVWIYVTSNDGHPSGKVDQYIRGQNAQ